MPWGIPESEIDEAAATLGLTAVENAYYSRSGHLVLVANGESFLIPRPADGRTNTLPRGPNRPASFLTGDSDPPKASSASNDVGPESPSEATVIASGAKQSPPLANNTTDTAAGLDDFTAIPGVGPVTAAILHRNGYYTYDDLRSAPRRLLTDRLGPRIANKIKAWLDQRLV